MTIHAMSAVLVFAALIGWAATAVLVRAAIMEDEPALSERAGVSILLSTLATLAALLGLNVLAGWAWPAEVRVWIAFGILVGLTAPQISWVVGWALGRFR